MPNTWIIVSCIFLSFNLFIKLNILNPVLNYLYYFYKCCQHVLIKHLLHKIIVLPIHFFSVCVDNIILLYTTI